MTKMFFDDDGNARCGKCNRLLFKVYGGMPVRGVEIKCHSCKELNCSDEDMLKSDEEKELDFIMSCFRTF